MILNYTHPVYLIISSSDTIEWVCSSDSWYSSLVLSLWTPLLISRFHLTLGFPTGSDPDQWIDFPIWPGTCLFTAELPDALGWDWCPLCCCPSRGAPTAPCCIRTLPCPLDTSSSPDEEAEAAQLDWHPWQSCIGPVVTVMRIFPVSIPVGLLSCQPDWQSGRSDGPCSQRQSLGLTALKWFHLTMQRLGHVCQ